MKRYIVMPINCYIKDMNILYNTHNCRDAVKYFNGACNKHNLCVYDSFDIKIIKSYKENLYIITEYNKTIAICEDYKEYAFSFNDFHSPFRFRVYDSAGNLLSSSYFQKPKIADTHFPSYLNYYTNNLKEKQEKMKNKGSVSIEIKGLDKLTDLDKVKTLEAYLSILRKNGFNNAKISNEYFKNLRFTVRKTFDENEKDYYTDFETAQLSCPVGYSVFDVLTGKCVYVKEKSIYDFKKEAEEGMKYKEAWGKLKEFLEDRKDIHATCADIFYVETYQTVLDAMKDLEGMIKNE